MNKLKKLKFIGKDTQLKIFLVLAIIVVLIAIFAPVIVPKDPFKQLGPSLQRPSNRFILGTDHLGRDLFSRIIYGSRYSIFMTLTLMFVIFAVGTILGVIAGYFGGVVDTVIMRIGDMMIAFPGLILAIAIAGLLNPSVKNSIIADGCRIDGIVENSILFRDVTVAQGAVIRNSVVMQDCVLERNSSIDYLVMDKRSVVRGGRYLSGCEGHPFFIEKNSIL